MPTSRQSNDNPAEPTGNNPAARLREIRAKVASLQGRIKTERNPKLVAELNAEVSKLSELLSEMISAVGTNAGPVTKSAPVIWPRDLTDESNKPSEWGTDPAEGGLE